MFIRLRESFGKGKAKMKPYKIIRYLEFNHLFEVFFLSSILTILGIRIYLAILGYPQLGAGEIHIAHMLWGGFFMVLSIFGFMTFLNDDFKPFWASLGGIGFGTFIDELGKFITNDNNYFFQPTFALIYVVFIVLYLIYKSFEKHQAFSGDEYLVNSLDKLKDAVIHDLDKEEKELALLYLSKSKKSDSLTKFLKKEFSKLEGISEEKIGLYTHIKIRLAELYSYFITKSWFIKIVVAVFIIRSLGYLITLFLLIGAVGYLFISGNIYRIPSPLNDILAAIEFGGILLQGVFIISGSLIIWRSRLKAYSFYRNAVFISVFILQVFNYYKHPTNALVSTIIDLLLLNILNYMISKERIQELKTVKVELKR